MHFSIPGELEQQQGLFVTQDRDPTRGQSADLQIQLAS